MAKIVSFDVNAIATLPVNHEIKLSDDAWKLDIDSLEHHDTDTGAQVVGTVTNPDGQRSIGLWYRNGEAILHSVVPKLLLVDNTPEPEPLEQTGSGQVSADVVTIFVNIYRSDKTDHGFTIGSRTGTSRSDMVARGERNTSGNYLTTVPVHVPKDALVEDLE